jgi:D-glycero-D-manno-heptose 1,7-bisphosphate phosphatase
LLAQAGVTLDAIYLCPHLPEDHCDCRKPLTGMVKQAIADFAFDPHDAVMIGDKEADIDLGRSIGAKTVLVRTGWGQDTEKRDVCQPDVIVDDLAAAASWILRQDRDLRS